MSRFWRGNLVEGRVRQAIIQTLEVLLEVKIEYNGQAQSEVGQVSFPWHDNGTLPAADTPAPQQVRR